MPDFWSCCKYHPLNVNHVLNVFPTTWIFEAIFTGNTEALCVARLYYCILALFSVFQEWNIFASGLCISCVANLMVWILPVARYVEIAICSAQSDGQSMCSSDWGTSLVAINFYFMVFPMHLSCCTTRWECVSHALIQFGQSVESSLTSCHLGSRHISVFL